MADEAPEASGFLLGVEMAAAVLVAVPAVLAVLDVILPALLGARILAP